MAIETGSLHSIKSKSDTIKGKSCVQENSLVLNQSTYSLESLIQLARSKQTFKSKVDVKDIFSLWRPIFSIFLKSDQTGLLLKMHVQRVSY